VVVWLTALAGTALGLFVSAFVSTTEQTMPALVGLVMTQLALGGWLFTVVGRPIVEQRRPTDRRPVAALRPDVAHGVRSFCYYR
jgi:hypothetical protein